MIRRLLLVVPAVVILANYYEWRVHRDVLHKRLWPFEVLVLARAPVARMPDLDAPRRDALAAILGRTLRRYDAPPPPRRRTC